MNAARKLAASVAVLAALVGLAWFGVLPGGWTLRGWIEPHAQRAAREQAERSAARLALFAPENRSAEAGSIVFLGSSTIERFPLSEAFPNRPCLNRGIGNETATELFERLDASLPDAPPAAVVLYAASLDFRRENRPPDILCRRVKGIVRHLRRRVPGSSLALIGLLSEREMPPSRVAALKEANAALEALCSELGVAFVSTYRPPVVDEAGAMTVACTADRLHLNATGYAHLTRWLLEDGGAVAELLRD